MGAEDIKKLFLFVAVFALFTSGIVATTPIFADKDDDNEDKKKDKKHKVLTGDGPPGDKLGKQGDGYIDNTSGDCDYYLKTAKKTWTLSQNLCTDTEIRADSFFDVFFDIELYSVDSFFDIFTELQSSSSRADSFFDVFFDIELYSVDSFFDIFTELQTDVDTIETEIVALDLRGQSCPQNQFVVGIDTLGDIICQPMFTPAPDCSAVNDCSDHGMCVSDNMCQCDAGFSGDDCSIPDNQCTAANCAQCIDGTTNQCAVCEPGWIMDSTGQCSLQPSTEICDGADNDLDGAIDEENVCDVLLGTYRFGTIITDCTLGGLPIGSASISEATIVSTDPLLFEIPISTQVLPTLALTAEGQLQYPAFGAAGSSSAGDASVRGNFIDFDRFDATVEIVDVSVSGFACDDVFRNIVGTK